MKTKRTGKSSRFATRPTKGTKTRYSLKNGPWEDHGIFLDSTGDGCTGWLQIGEHVGRYAHGHWETWAEYDTQRKQWERLDARRAA